MNIDPATLDAKALAGYADNAHKLQGGGFGSFLLNIIPTTVVRRAGAQRRAAGAVLRHPVRRLRSRWSASDKPSASPS